MESPPKESTKQYGCTGLLVRLAIGIAVIFVLDYVVTMIFRSVYKHDDITQALIPFQNGYLARTDAFITSEGAVNEFSDDPGAVSRFLGLVIIPLIGVFILFSILSAIPLTRKVADYTRHAILISLVILMFDSLFVPPVMTVFDRDSKVMIIHRPEWMFWGTTTEIPFGKITGFNYKLEQDPGINHRDDVTYADIYAETSDGPAFIGESQVGMHEQTLDATIDKERQQEIDAAILALKLIVGAPSEFTPPAE